MKKKNWYPILIFAGLILIISGIFTLSESISQKNTFQIWIRSILLVFWITFTISNYFLFRKEARKRKEQ